MVREIRKEKKSPKKDKTNKHEELLKKNGDVHDDEIVTNDDHRDDAINDSNKKIVDKKDKKKKHKKEKKAKHTEEETAVLDIEIDSYDGDKEVQNSSNVNNDSAEKKSKKEKKEKRDKKSKRKRSDSQIESNDSEDEDGIDQKNDDDDCLDDTKEKRKIERKKRRLERQQLVQKVPQVDENGIAYSKQQIRRMMKRVARGLDPIESQQEKQERRQREAQLRKEEEMELAGLVGDSNGAKMDVITATTTDDDDSTVDDHNNSKNDDSEHDDDVGIQFDTKEKSVVRNATSMQDSLHSPSTTDANSSALLKKKKARHETKAVPSDYVCSACQNKHDPPHWIYDCPDKKNPRHEAAKKGPNNPVQRKVFVSGLPFDIRMKDVMSIFNSRIQDNKVMECKLFRFNDSRRCNGQACLTFDNEVGAQKALALSGMKIDNAPNDDDGNQQGTPKSSSGKSKRELVLQVTTCMNRYEKKRQLKGQNGMVK